MNTVNAPGSRDAELTAQPEAPALLESISVVMPTLNEEAELRETIRRLRLIREVREIIVADAGSSDATRQLAAELGCRVLDSPRGRGRQMRHGAKHAVGDVVLLLHADTWMEPGAGRAILTSLHQSGAVGGGCWKAFRDPSWLMRGSRFKCWLRFQCFGRFMGDQAMFIRRDALEKIGGVPDVPIMEEYELARALRAIGRLVLAATTVSTSARRFRQRGVVRTYLRMGRVTLAYWRGTPLEELKRLYER
jgi:rSAM/selenodomain-associated transferase 2